MTNDLPTGTVTFLFTDIEGSTKLWERHPEAMQAALARHDALLRSAVAANNGTIIKTTGDGLHAVNAKPLSPILQDGDSYYQAQVLILGVTATGPP